MAAIQRRHDRIRTRAGRLCIDLPVDSFQPAFTNFTSEAEEFAMSLTDRLHRRFAYQYLGYLQEVANGLEPIKTNTVSGRPACRLICTELERIFRQNFYKPIDLAA
jgi:hypothetical protein